MVQIHTPEAHWELFEKRCQITELNGLRFNFQFSADKGRR